jgi:hypothetical protein
MREIIDNFKNDPSLLFCRNGFEDGPKRIGRTTLFADDLPRIPIADPQPQNRCVITFDNRYRDIFGCIDQCLSNCFCDFFHRPFPFAVVLLVPVEVVFFSNCQGEDPVTSTGTPFFPSSAWRYFSRFTSAVIFFFCNR